MGSPGCGIMYHAIPGSYGSPRSRGIRGLPFGALSIATREGVGVFFRPYQGKGIPSSPGIYGQLYGMKVIGIFGGLRSRRVTGATDRVKMAQRVGMGLRYVNCRARPYSSGTIFVNYYGGIYYRHSRNIYSGCLFYGASRGRLCAPYRRFGHFATICGLFNGVAMASGQAYGGLQGGYGVDARISRILQRKHVIAMGVGGVTRYLRYMRTSTS